MDNRKAMLRTIKKQKNNIAVVPSSFTGKGNMNVLLFKSSYCLSSTDKQFANRVYFLTILWEKEQLNEIVRGKKIFQINSLTGKEGGRRMCFGEQVSEPTAITAFTGIVNICERKKQYPSYLLYTYV